RFRVRVVPPMLRTGPDGCRAGRSTTRSAVHVGADVPAIDITMRLPFLLDCLDAATERFKTGCWRAGLRDTRPGHNVAGQRAYDAILAGHPARHPIPAVRG